MAWSSVLTNAFTVISWLNRGVYIASKCRLYTKTWLRQGAVAADPWRTSDAYGGAVVCLLAGTHLECGLPLNRS